ncbi:MAG: hypothetical protein JNL67_01800 [Planctomycetaceae bacterium]|nr:hypothetical protein [Planctomycetaceae bacterium]
MNNWIRRHRLCHWLPFGVAVFMGWVVGTTEGQSFRPLVKPDSHISRGPAPAARYFQATAPQSTGSFQPSSRRSMLPVLEPSSSGRPPGTYGNVQPIQYLNDLTHTTGQTGYDSPELELPNWQEPAAAAPPQRVASGLPSNVGSSGTPVVNNTTLGLQPLTNTEGVTSSDPPNGLPNNTNSGPAPISTPNAPNTGIAGSLGGTSFLLAEQPRADARFEYAPPGMSSGAALVEYSPYDFSDELGCWEGYDPSAQQNVYMGKSLNRTQRPLVEWFKPWYNRGQIKPGITLFGTHNPIIPQFLVYGDYRTAWASNTANGNNFSVWAHRLNLDFDLRITSTERIHWFMTPLNRGPNFTRLLDDGDSTFISELNPDVIFGYFEGDLGAMWGGVTNKTLPFDLPFAIGVMPLLFQNGVWLEDAFLGAAATIPARNSPLLDIANMDTTFFVGFDNVSSPAFNNENSAANLYGFAQFIEAWGGYMELDYAYLEDNRILDRSYHNTSVAFTRRFGTWLSNSVRIINNSGQNPNGIEQTADGTLLLLENSLITNYPSTRIPYFNFFAGFDRPQSAARDPLSGGVLRNTGILFETDGLTGFPFLDDTANNTLGGAMGLNLLADDFSQQLVLETAMVLPMEGKLTQAGDPQYGAGLRYQIPLNNTVILRSDLMYGMRESNDDLHGVRVELRKKW